MQLERRSIVSLPDIAGRPEVVDLIRRALAEDVGAGDVTTLALVPESAEVEARVVSRGAVVVSGTGVAEAVFTAVDERVVCDAPASDGQRVGAGQPVLRVRGPARGILTAERTALNFMQRMTGIATLTRAFVDRTATHGVTVLDTRKTTPLLRVLEKYAVLCGGGENHRMGLYDRALIKDNHRRLWGGAGESRLDEAVREVRNRFPGLPVEVEVESEEELESALREAPEWILLDNMSVTRLARCVRLCDGRCKLEASGGITLDNAEDVARTGVDAISLGRLTHSAPAADLSLEIGESA